MTNQQYMDAAVKVKPFLEEVWKIQKDSGFFIETFGEGMVYGYLLGKGLSSEEVNIGTSIYNSMMSKIVKDNPNLIKKGKSIVFGEDGKIKDMVS